MSNTMILVDDFAALSAQIKELTEKRDAIKKQLIQAADFGLNDKGVECAILIGDRANVVITKTYPVTFSKDLAQTLLSAEDFDRCHATAIKPTLTPRVIAKSASFA